MGKSSKRQVRLGNKKGGSGAEGGASAQPRQQHREDPSGGRRQAEVDAGSDGAEGRNPRRRRLDNNSSRIGQKGDEETADNLHFEDPFPDQEDEDGGEWSDVVVEDDDEDDNNDDGDEDGILDDEDDDHGGVEEKVKAWNPFTLDDEDGPGGEGRKTGARTSVSLEMDPSAYRMHHALAPEWPSLSFDFLRDDLGSRSASKFPHSLVCVVGTQAVKPGDNRVTVMKMSDLGRIRVETEDDILGEEYDPTGGGDEDKETDDDDMDNDENEDDDVDMDPIVEHYSIRHYGGVNRIRSMPQRPSIVATWSEAGRVNLFDVDPILQRFSASVGEGWKASAASDATSKSGTHARIDDLPSKPYFSYAKHGTEGYALDWSPHAIGALVSGDCHGGIHLWNPRQDGSYVVSKSYGSNSNENEEGLFLSAQQSVEDLQWSPNESTVFASAECGGCVRIYDTRAPNRAMISRQIHANRSDVNVLAWNALVTNLLATGSDDGVLSVWDLRHFAASGSSDEDKPPTPLARFTPHTTPITSVEWHPTDESMLVMTDDRGAYVYDLSVEEDDAGAVDAAAALVREGSTSSSKSPALPPQLLFVHCGSEQFKEVHWHPQIPSLLMTTALSGYSVFIPSNL